MIFDKFTLSLITSILGFGIWNIQRFMEDRKNAHAKVLKQDNLVRAIYAEIDFNTTDMGMKPIIFNHLVLGDIQKTHPPLPHA